MKKKVSFLNKETLQYLAQIGKILLENLGPTQTLDVLHRIETLPRSLHIYADQNYKWDRKSLSNLTSYFIGLADELTGIAIMFVEHAECLDGELDLEYALKKINIMKEFIEETKAVPDVIKAKLDTLGCLALDLEKKIKEDL